MEAAPDRNRPLVATLAEFGRQLGLAVEVDYPVAESIRPQQLRTMCLISRAIAGR